MAFLLSWISCSYCLWFPLFLFLVARFIQDFSNSLVPYEDEKKYVCLLMNNGSVKRKILSTTTEKIHYLFYPFFILFNNAIERLIQDVFFISSTTLLILIGGLSLDPILPLQHPTHCYSFKHFVWQQDYKWVFSFKGKVWQGLSSCVAWWSVKLLWDVCWWWD